jgi:hypothetical protein
MLKKNFVNTQRKVSLLSELIPLRYSEYLPIEEMTIERLHRFAQANPIYQGSHESNISNVPCRVYEGDINRYWLSSKKYDTSYQSFYPTWILSAFSLVLKAKLLGFEQIVDIGSGDGRIAYCARLLGMQAFGIEIVEDLILLQEIISERTGIKYDAVPADATRFDYRSLPISHPMFFISGLPEMGEMLACSVIDQIRSIGHLKRNSGFTFMGSHEMRSLSRDHTTWGWGSVISRFGLAFICEVTLPTHWTTDQMIDTAYVFTKFK